MTINKEQLGINFVILENVSGRSLEKYHKQPLTNQGSLHCIPEPGGGLITQRDAMTNQQVVLECMSRHRRVSTHQTTRLHLAGTFYSLAR